jgi:hypothetical protein
MTVEDLIFALKRLTRGKDEADFDVVYEVDDNENTAEIYDVELKDGKVVLK